MILKTEEASTRFFEFNDSANPLRLHCGDKLDRYVLAYESYGTLNADRSNAILVFHAMTGSQHAAGFNPKVPGVGERWTEELHEGWWDAFIGPGKALDTRHFYVVCANYLGGCYGSTGPSSVNPETGQIWGPTFPVLRMCDIVDSQIRLLDYLGIGRLHAVLGPSIGGFLALNLATRYPERVGLVIPMGTGLGTTSLQRILNFEQISAIEADPNFNKGDYYGRKVPDAGLALARRIAHKTFISLDALQERAREEVLSEKSPFGWYSMNSPVESYMLHQGLKFVRRFDANTYLRILDAWQWFDLAAEGDAKHLSELFSRCCGQRFLVFSIDSDAAFYPAEQSKLVHALKKAHLPVTWITVHSDKGHDSFLLEPTLFTPHLNQALSYPTKLSPESEQ